MKFSEKLQKLRKENNYSQEQLADMLDVSRQSVSKWESGQTYPEMDKLLSMCKIFKCSLDDLTNDEVSTTNINNKTKNQFNNLIDEFLSLISRSGALFTRLGAKETVKIIIKLIIVALMLSIFRIPVDYLISLGNTVFNLMGEYVGNVLRSIWVFIINIAYFAFYFVALIYIYKSQFLDKYDKELPTEESKKTNNDESDNQRSINSKKNETPIFEKRTNGFLDIIGKIALIFIKIIVFFISIPFMISFLGMFCALIISLILLFKGVCYIGLILCLIFAILLNYVVLDSLMSFILSHTIKATKIIAIFLISLAGLGIGGGIFALEISQTEYKNKVPEEIKLNTYEDVVKMQEELIIYSDYYNINTTYVVDNSLGNNVIIERSYDKRYVDLSIIEEDNYIYFDRINNDSINKDMFNMLINNLKNKQLYNYSLLYHVDITIKSTDSNIKKLKENTMKSNNYDNQELDSCRQEKDDYLTSINKLEEENESLKEEKEYLEEKISNYKEQISSILND